jgi:hypothetical protein
MVDATEVLFIGGRSGVGKEFRRLRDVKTARYRTQQARGNRGGNLDMAYPRRGSTAWRRRLWR